MEKLTNLRDFFSTSHNYKFTQDSKRDSIPNLSSIFREHVTITDNVTPYGYEGSPPSPGLLTLLTLPLDVIDTGAHFVKGVKKKDGEEIFDTTLRAITIPGVGYASSESILSFFLDKMHAAIIGATITGAIVCFLAAIYEAVLFVRQKLFERDFDLELLSKLNYLVGEDDPLNSTEAAFELAQYVEKNKASLEKIFGTEPMETIETLAKQLQKDLMANPYHVEQVLPKYQEALEELSRHLLIKNLATLQNKYLQVSSEEVKTIGERVSKKYSKTNIPSDIIDKEIENGLIKELNKKKKALARRVRPWMVTEAGELVTPLLKDLVTKPQDSTAIKEGLKLMNDIRTQNKKKKIAHALAVIGLLMLAASFVLLLPVAHALAAAYVLMVIGTILATGRMVFFQGMSDLRGWDFNLKMLVPKTIREKIWDPILPTDTHQEYREQIVSKRMPSRTFEKHDHECKVNLEKLRAPVLSEKSQELLRSSQIVCNISQVFLDLESSSLEEMPPTIEPLRVEKMYF